MNALPPIVVSCDPDSPVPAASARYSPADATLIVGARGQLALGDARLSAGTVTFAFAGRERKLVGLDAYTNMQQWARDVIVPPNAPDAPVLSLATFDENGIAAGPPDTPAFRYDGRTACLAIDVQPGDPMRACRCLTCVVAEIGPIGELLTLYVERVSGAPHV